MRLILIRHGQTSSNIGHLLDTAPPGPPLTGLGHQQAGDLVRTLSGEQITGVYVSDLVRTHQTAAPLAGHLDLPVVERGGLREIQAGDEEMARYDPAAPSPADHYRYFHCLRAWVGGDLTARIPGGETGHEFLERFDAVVTELQAHHECAAAVSHGAALRVWCRHRCTNLGPHFLREAPMDNGQVNIVQGSENRWRAVLWGDHPVPQ